MAARLSSMKKILLDIHIYLSLLCAGYMIIYGVSGIAFNHQLHPTDAPGATWEASIDVPVFDKDQASAEAARDRLQLVGWVPNWRLSHPQPDQLLFFVNRPSREYRVLLHQVTGSVQVQETSRGLLGAILGLHGLGKMPNSTWSRSWSIYTQISTWALIFSVLSGIWFWWLRPGWRRSGWWMLGLGSGGCVLFMLYIIG